MSFDNPYSSLYLCKLYLLDKENNWIDKGTGFPLITE